MNLLYHHAKYGGDRGSRAGFRRKSVMFFICFSSICHALELHCWLGHVTRKTVYEMTCNVSSGTLNSTIPYHRGKFIPKIGIFLRFLQLQAHIF